MINKSFSHLNKNNSPKMVNITKKNISKRAAVAEGIVRFSKLAFNKMIKFKSTKGEIKNVAILAGTIASKKTSELIPLCHNIPIENIKIEIKTQTSLKSLKITCAVNTSAKTGVEMEALTGVSIACLTIYDMCKNLDKGITINNIRLIKKTGGKSESYKSE